MYLIYTQKITEMQCSNLFYHQKEIRTKDVDPVWTLISTCRDLDDSKRLQQLSGGEERKKPNTTVLTLQVIRAFTKRIF